MTHIVISSAADSVFIFRVIPPFNKTFARRGSFLQMHFKGICRECVRYDSGVLSGKRSAKVPQLYGTSDWTRLTLHGDLFRFSLQIDYALEWQTCAIQIQNSKPKCLLSKNQTTYRTSGDHWHWKTLISCRHGAFVSQASTSFHFIHYCLMEIIDFFFWPPSSHMKNTCD